MTVDDERFKGDILIYVDGYCVDDFRCIEHNLPDGFPSPTAGGWAVGNNARDRYCSRMALDKVRRFEGYDEAVRYIEIKRRKRKNERFQLIYHLGKHFHKVSTLDDILLIDEEAGTEKALEAAWRARLKGECEEEYPELDTLKKVASRNMAFSASELLGIIRKDGVEAARKRYAKDSYYRLLRVLRDAGLKPA